MQNFGDSTRRSSIHLDKEDGQFAAHLVESTLDQLVEEFGLSTATARAMQQYIVLVCVVDYRRRKQIPFAKEFKQAKSIQRCLDPAARKLLCDELRFAL